MMSQVNHMNKDSSLRNTYVATYANLFLLFNKPGTCLVYKFHIKSIFRYYFQYLDYDHNEFGFTRHIKILSECIITYATRMENITHTSYLQSSSSCITTVAV